VTRAQHGAEQMELVHRGVKNETSRGSKEREFHIIEEQPTQEGKRLKKAQVYKRSQNFCGTKGFHFNISHLGVKLVITPPVSTGLKKQKDRAFGCCCSCHSKIIVTNLVDYTVSRTSHFRLRKR
jgi:hypothetical protein